MNVFTNPYNGTETWSAQGAIVQWGINGQTSTKFPLMMLNLVMNYQRQVAKFYPVNTDGHGNMTKYNISGAPQGMLQVGSIYGPSAVGLRAFIEAVAKDCKLPEDAVSMSIRPFGNLKCGGSGSGFTNNQEFILKGLELETIGIQIQGGEVAVVNLPQTYSFTSLEWKF